MMLTDKRRDRAAEGTLSPLSLAGLGVQFVGALLLFAYVGAKLDDRFASSPLFLLAGVMIGGGGTFYLGIRRVLRRGKGTR